MPSGPKQINITFTAKQMEQIETLTKLTGDDMTNIIRKAVTELHDKVVSDEDAKKLAKINAILDVQ